MKKSLIVGYGSIGKRHAEILTNMGHEVHLVSQQNHLPFPTYPDLSEALSQGFFPLIIIATPTAAHAASLQLLSEHDFQGTVLVEKPLFHTALPSFSYRYPDRIFVAYNLRFHPILQRLHALIQGKKLYAASIIVGQYLPQWRPGSDHLSSYSAHRQQGGGVLRDLSHEIDYAAWLLGPCHSLTALGGRFSSVTVDSDDCFSILATHARCPSVNLQMNYLDDMARRQIIIHSEIGTIFVDLIAATLQTEHDREQFSVERNTSYINQLQCLTSGSTDNLCSYQEGMATMHVIEAAEKAALEKRWITL